MPFTTPLTSPRTTRCSWSHSAGSGSGTSQSLNAGGHVLVPWRTRVAVAPSRGREHVRRYARDDGMPVFVDVVEPKTVGQGRVPGKHRLGDFDACLGMAGRRTDPGPASVDESKGLGVLDADAQRPVGVAFAPGRVAEDMGGGGGRGRRHRPAGGGHG